jgi:tetratricopeptide (TPR) repeat protein
MGARMRALHLIPALAAALALLVACGPPTPEELLEQAEIELTQNGDATEAELTLRRLLSIEDLDPEIAVQAHMLRAGNFARGLNQVDRARAELEAIVDLVGVGSEQGLQAAMILATTHLEEGIEAYDAEVARLTAGLPASSEEAMEVSLHRWMVVTGLNATNEIWETHGPTIDRILAAETLRDDEKRDLVLRISLQVVEQANLRGQPQLAVELLERFIEQFPGSDPAEFMPFQIAGLWSQAGETELAESTAAEAFARLDERVAAAQTSAEVAILTVMRGDAHVMLGDFDAAGAVYEYAFNNFLDYPRRPEAMLSWSVTLAQRGSGELARELATRLALEYPNSDYDLTANRLIQGIDAGVYLPAPPPAPAEMEADVPASPEAVSEPLSPEIAQEMEPIEETPEPVSPEPTLEMTAAEPSPEIDVVEEPVSPESAN